MCSSDLPLAAGGFGDIVSIESTSTSQGGNDTITGGDGDDVDRKSVV